MWLLSVNFFSSLILKPLTKNSMRVAFQKLPMAGLWLLFSACIVSVWDCQVAGIKLKWSAIYCAGVFYSLRKDGKISNIYSRNKAFSLKTMRHCRDMYLQNTVGIKQCSFKVLISATCLSYYNIVNHF